MRNRIWSAILLGTLLFCQPALAGEFDFLEFSAAYAEFDDKDGAYVDAYATSMGLTGSTALLDNLAFDLGLLLERSNISDFESKSNVILFGPNLHFSLTKKFEMMLRYTAIRDETSTRAPNGDDLGNDSDFGESVSIGLRTRLDYTDFVDFSLFEQELYGVIVDGYSLEVVLGNESSAFVIGFSSAKNTGSGLTSDGASLAFRAYLN